MKRIQLKRLIRTLRAERDELRQAEQRAYADATKAQRRLKLIKEAMRDNGDTLTVQVKIDAILRGEYDNE